MTGVEAVLFAALAIALAFVLGSMLRHVTKWLSSLVLGVFGLGMLLFFVVMADTSTTRTLLSGEKVFVLTEGDGIVTGFNVSDEGIVLWSDKEVLRPEGELIAWFSLESFAQESTEFGGREVPTMVLQDVVVSEDVIGSLSFALHKVGPPMVLGLDEETARSFVFASLVRGTLEDASLFELVREGRVRFEPERITFKLMKWVPSFAVPWVEPLIGVELEADA